MSHELTLADDLELSGSHERTIERVTEALREQGFGILTTIDLHAAFREKLGLEYHPHTILGACNPPLAHRAITTDPTVGLMLPCNVTVETAPGAPSVVRFVNPEAMLGIGDLAAHPALEEVARDATERLERVVAALRTAGARPAPEHPPAAG